MNNLTRIPLAPHQAQCDALVRLQRAFAAACNALSPLVAERRVWNRVTLHHLAYRELRERFPELGSQMACNAIYAVCRAARLVYQHPKSPFNIARRPQAPLPRLKFNDDAPVYFDRHTLSLRVGAVSIFGLEGRMQCPAQLSRATCERLGAVRLREVALTRKADQFTLVFKTGDDASVPTSAKAELATQPAAWPQHLSVIAGQGDGTPPAADVRGSGAERPGPSPMHPRSSEDSTLR